MHRISREAFQKQRRMLKSSSRPRRCLTDNETGYVAFSPRPDDDMRIRQCRRPDSGSTSPSRSGMYAETRAPSFLRERKKTVPIGTRYIVRCMLIMTSLQSNLANSASLIWHALHSMPEPSNHANWAGKAKEEPNPRKLQGRAGQGKLLLLRGRIRQFNRRSDTRSGRVLRP
jgi:hypothetical protein